MSDLSVILASGDLASIQVNSSEVVTEAGLQAALASGDLTSIRVEGEELLRASNVVQQLSEGLPIPEVLTADADNGVLFFDSSEGELRYKSPGGIALRIRVQVT